MSALQAVAGQVLTARRDAARRAAHHRRGSVRCEKRPPRAEGENGSVLVATAEENLRAQCGRIRSEGADNAGLANTRLADHCEDAAVALLGLLERLAELRPLGLAADQQRVLTEQVETGLLCVRPLVRSFGIRRLCGALRLPPD